MLKIKVLASIDIRLVVWKANELLATRVYGAFLLENHVHANCSLLDRIFRMKILSCDNVCKVSTKTM